jgi:hypothetical protein
LSGIESTIISGIHKKNRSVRSDRCDLFSLLGVNKKISQSEESENLKARKYIATAAVNYLVFKKWSISTGRLF